MSSNRSPARAPAAVETAPELGMARGRLTAWLWALSPAPGGYWLYLGALAAVGVATAIMSPARDQLNTLTVALVYLLVCQLFGLVAGPGPAAAAALLAFLALNFFFVPPYFTLAVAGEQSLLALIAFLAVALITIQLMAVVRRRTDEAIREQRRASLLYELNAALVRDVRLDDILAAIVKRVVTVYGAVTGRILLPDVDEQPRVVARFPSSAPTTLDRTNQAVATWALEHRAPAGRRRAGRRIHQPSRPSGDRPLLPAEPELNEAGTDVLYIPIATAERVIGLLEVTGRPGGGRFRPEDETLLSTFADQAALALDRVQLSEEAARAAALAQSDELKSALLAAVSHDLRTPLASIKAAATSLMDTSVAWSDEARTELLDAIDQETDRLSLMVGNLLDLSRIEGGALRPDKEWYDVAELVADVTHRLAGRTEQHPVTTEIEPALPLALFDYVEIAQVLTNLIENAVKYTPPGTPITIQARATIEAGAPVIEIAVDDQGPGIPFPHQARLFEKFYRGDARRGTPGTGIGLAISKGLVEAHGGRIWVESAEGAGASFRFTLPLPSAEPSQTTAGGQL